jgi:hypothetical protein
MTVKIWLQYQYTTYAFEVSAGSIGATEAKGVESYEHTGARL